MRVLWVFHGLQPQWVQVANLVADQPDWSLDILGQTSAETDADLHNIDVKQLHCRQKIDFSARRQIRSQIANEQYDLVHAYSSKNLANVIAACRGLDNAPKIIGYRGTISRLRVLDPANWITFWHPRVAKIVCASHAVRHALLDSGIPSSKLSAVIEGYVAGPTTGAIDRNELSTFDIPQDAFVVGTIANMRRVKGIDLLLQAALELGDLSNIYFLLIGEAIDSRVRKLASDPRIADRVRLAGPIPNAGRLTKLFDIYAAPSRMEGLGLAVLEAMSQQVCPLVSNVGGLVELVEHGSNGLVVASEDVRALAESIRQLHGDSSLRQRLAEAAYDRTRTEFSIESWAQRLLAVYEATARNEIPRDSFQSRGRRGSNSGPKAAA